MASKKVKVRVLNATVDGHGPGEVISIDERSVDHLESIRYVARLGSAPEKEMKQEMEDDSDE